MSGIKKILSYEVITKINRHTLSWLMIFLIFAIVSIISFPSLLLAGNLAYVSNSSSNNVSVLDITTNTVVNYIAVGVNPRHMAINSDGSRLYVVNAPSRNVSVINTETNAVIATIPVVYSPWGIAITPDDSRLYIGIQSNLNLIYVIDTISNSVIDSFPAGGYPQGLAISPDGSTLWVNALTCISVFETATNSNVAIISLNNATQDGIAFSPDGSLVYSVLWNAGVAVIDTDTYDVITIIPTMDEPWDLLMSSSGLRAYVSHGYPYNSVSVIDTTTNTVIEVMTVGQQPHEMAETLNGNYVYVANTFSGSNSLSVIDTSTNTVINTITGGFNCPYGIIMKPLPNLSPEADPNGPYLGAAGSSIYFDGTGSSDPDSDLLTYFWKFGDSATGSGATPSYTYDEAGIYDLCLTVSDGKVDSEEVCTIVVVYDLSAGFVTGGGWIDSPEGAYAQDPTLTGKATFGFISKYKKGATEPSGQTEFQFQTADLNFHSVSYEWLVVTGSDYAMFKGVGTINGYNDANGFPYKFKLWAGDNEPDTFRIKIWEEDTVEEAEQATEIVVYDNGFEGSGYENGQPISGGSIVIHTKK
jgi:YVTN family beta-propeller protein